ncbi:hypothetical protein SDC9_182745 [bioreactor metagenome]|uniref:Uncharacterized protein n=1 Tax=bioreactor metagenome TaxID=1076179 RepID=A0A645H8E0_9ZZZZ
MASLHRHFQGTLEWRLATPCLNSDQHPKAVLIGSTIPLHLEPGYTRRTAFGPSDTGHQPFEKSQILLEPRILPLCIAQLLSKLHLGSALDIEATFCRAGRLAQGCHFSLQLRNPSLPRLQIRRQSNGGGAWRQMPGIPPGATSHTYDKRHQQAAYAPRPWQMGADCHPGSGNGKALPQAAAN